MTLKSLAIEKQWYGPDKGLFKGKIAFEGEQGTVEINLGHADCAKLLPIVAEGIISTSREVAERLTAECVAASPIQTLKIG